MRSLDLFPLLYDFGDHRNESEREKKSDLLGGLENSVLHARGRVCR